MEHLEQWAQFQAVMSASKVWRTPHFVLHQWQPKDVSNSNLSQNTLVLGALTPKRWAKRAVTRNLLKRQIFNVARAFAHGLPPTAYVVRLSAAFDAKHYVSASSEALKLAARQELTQLFAKLTAS